MRSIPQTLNVPSFSLSWGLNYDDNDGNAKNYYCQHAFGVSRVPGAILSTLRALFELKLNRFKWDLLLSPCYRRGNRAPNKRRDFSKVTQLIISRGRLKLKLPVEATFLIPK